MYRSVLLLGKLKDVERSSLSVGMSLDKSLLSGLLQLSASVFTFGKASGSLQACNRQCSIDPSHSE